MDLNLMSLYSRINKEFKVKLIATETFLRYIGSVPSMERYFHHNFKFIPLCEKSKLLQECKGLIKVNKL